MQYLGSVVRRLSDARESVAESRFGQMMANAYDRASEVGKAASEFVADHPYEAAASGGLAAVGMAVVGAPATLLAGVAYTANATGLVAATSYVAKQARPYVLEGLVKAKEGLQKLKRSRAEMEGREENPQLEPMNLSDLDVHANLDLEEVKATEGKKARVIVLDEEGEELPEFQKQAVQMPQLEDPNPAFLFQAPAAPKAQLKKAAPKQGRKNRKESKRK